ncbi:MAG: thymidylate kinase, partial [Actinomycetota bacterium]|nr:thymidylate kinase [Actinomycetota bacterium]
PGLVLVAGEPDASGIPLLAGRPLVHGEAAAYVCRGMVCDRPVTSPADLAVALQAAKV